MASREQDKAPDKAIDGLLRRSLAHTSPSHDCPAPDILAAYYDRSLDAQETARYDLHFSTCSHCRAQLAAMVRAGEPEGAEKQSSGWGWLTHRWWFVPALATAALALVVSVPLARKIYNPPVPAQQVAMNAPVPAAAPASEQSKGSPRDSETVADKQLLDRLSEKTAPSGAPTASSESNLEKKSKALRLVAPQALPRAKSPTVTPAGSMNTQVTEAAPLIAKSQTDRLDAADSAPAPPSSAASRRVAPVQSAGARSSGGAAGGFTAQNQVQKQNQSQNQRQSQQQSQPQNEVTVPAQSQTVQVEAQEAPQADSASSGVIGGLAESAPRSDSKKLSTSTSSAHAAVGKAASKGATAGMRNAKESSVPKVFTSPDSDARWRLPGAGVVEFSPNAGQTWQGKLLDANAQLLTGAAPGGKVFWIVGRDSVIYLTTNGTKWKTITPPVTADFVDISAHDARFASVTTSDHRVFTTEDGGKTWTAAQ
jgi:hypothetical protein